jgi:hypothetical protein
MEQPFTAGSGLLNMIAEIFGGTKKKKSGSNRIIWEGYFLEENQIWIKLNIQTCPRASRGPAFSLIYSLK